MKYPLTPDELDGLSKSDRRKHNWYGFRRNRAERKTAVLARRRKMARASRRRNR